MPKLTCPECDKAVTIPAGTRTARCPACGSKIGTPSRDEDEEEREEEEEQEERKPRKKKKKGAKKAGRDSERIRGLIPLILFGPLGLGLAIWAPFSGYGTALSMVLSFPLMICGVFSLNRIYRSTGLLEERIRPDADEKIVLGAIMIDSAFCAFKHPRLLASWAALTYISLLMIIMGVIGLTVFKRLEEGPPNQPGPNQPGPPAGPPKESDDAIIAKALTNLESKDNVTNWGGFDELAKVKPNQRRAEVVGKVRPHLDSKDTITREKAVRALGVWGGPEDIPTLTKLLDDKGFGIPDAALFSLGRLRAPVALPLLIDRLSRNEEVMAIVRGYGPDAEDAILARVGPGADKKWFESSIWYEGAVDVLKEIGTQKSVPFLERGAQLGVNDIHRSKPAKEALTAIQNRTKT